MTRITKILIANRNEIAFRIRITAIALVFAIDWTRSAVFGARLR